MPTLEQITTHAKTYGFLYPSSQIYQGIQAVYDYGPYGVMLKKKIQDLWWKSITRLHNNVVGLDAAILMHPNTWQASGHIEGFNDWMIDHKESKKRYRVDLLLEEHATKLIDAGKKQKAETLLANMKNYIDQENASGLNKLINQENIICPLAKNANWTKPKKRNLMLATTLGTTEQTGLKTYLRPETAQGIFVNFLSIQKTTRSKIPFGVAQIGKAFRNEIVARQFIFRMREFEQMEMQYFTAPNQQDTWFNYWKNTRLNWYHALNIPKKNLRIHKHQQLAHYARTALDIQYHFPFGYQEIEGIHARSDFDLKNHQKLSGKKLSYLDPTSHTTYIPHIVETSAGCDRIVLMLLCQAFKQEKTTTGLTRTYLQIPPPLAPIQAAILPLMKKDALCTYGTKLLKQLNYHFDLNYEESASIGKRYARQDLIGTPYCLTIDHQTLQDDTLTVRDRDTMQQHRLPANQIPTFLKENTDITSILKKLYTTQPSLPH